jgi:hypothetical protein
VPPGLKPASGLNIYCVAALAAAAKGSINVCNSSSMIGVPIPLVLVVQMATLAA